MIIATLNVDWAKTQKSRSLISQYSNLIDAEFLILTESVDLTFDNYQFIYRTSPLPLDKPYEGIEYSKFISGSTAHRVIIYSKYECNNTFTVSDDHTSICKQFDTEIGSLVIYATIIGTQFNRKPYAENELQNCIKDCSEIAQKTKQFCLTGDLNTSFKDQEIKMEIPGIHSQSRLSELCGKCNLELTTKNIDKNIDHIFLSKSISQIYQVSAQPFIQKEVISDHQGILVDIRE